MLSKALIVKLITITALKYGVDPKIAIAVAQKESSLNPNSIGLKHEVGLFQLLPESFPGYAVRQLLDPKTNIKLGVKYMITVKRFCKYKENLEWLSCWNYGISNVNKKVKHPSKFPYVKQIKAIIAENERE